MPASVKNDKLIDTLSGHFVRSYGSSYGLSSAVPMYQMLPRLRAFWPCSSYDENNALYDLSGQGRTLTNNNTVGRGMHGIVQYSNFTRASNESYSRPDEAGLSLTGGIGLLCWCWFDAESTGNDAGLISKWFQSVIGPVNLRSYSLYKTSTNVFRFIISDNGTTEYSIDSTVAYAESQWFFIGGFFSPSTYMRTFVNGTWDEDTTGIPASVYDNNRPFYLGAHNEANHLDGRMTLVAVTLPPSIQDGNYVAAIESLYQHTRGLFGIRS